MAIPNYIGNIPFYDLRGEPGFTRQVTRTIQYPGVDGTAVKLTGFKCPPFQMESIADYAYGGNDTPFIVARDGAFREYASRIGTEGHIFVWKNRYMGLVAVLNVEPIQTKTVSCIVGGINVPNGYPAVILRARWNLVFIG